MTDPTMANSSWSPQLSPNTEKYLNLCVLCWLSHISWFPGPKYIPPYFWPQVTNYDIKSKISKSNFLGHCSFTQLVRDVIKLSSKPKIFVNVILRFWYVHHVGVIFLKNWPEAAKVATPVKIFNVGLT